MKVQTSTTILALKVTVTVAILAYIYVRYVDVDTYSALFFSLDWLVIAGVLVVNIPVRLMMAWQLKLNLDGYGIRSRVGDLFKIQQISTFYAFVLPGDLASGGVSWYLLSRNTEKRAEIASAIIFVRLASLMLLVPLGILGAAMDQRLLSGHSGILFLSAFIILTIFTIPFFAPRFANAYQKIIDAVIQRLPLSSGVSGWMVRTNGAAWAAISRTASMGWQRIASVYIVGILIHVLSAAIVLLMLKACQINMNIYATFYVLAVLALVSLIPATIAGIGLREASLLSILAGDYGAPPENVLLFSLVVLLVMIVFGAMLGGYYSITYRTRP